MKDGSRDYEITFSDAPAADDVEVLSEGLRRHGGAIFGQTWIKSVAFFLRDSDGKIVGGVFGNYGVFEWMYVDSLWVSDDLRGRGLGADPVRVRRVRDRVGQGPAVHRRPAAEAARAAP